MHKITVAKEQPISVSYTTPAAAATTHSPFNEGFGINKQVKTILMRGATITCVDHLCTMS